MAEYRVERFNYEPLEFEGEVLCRLKTDPVPAAGAARQFELALYETNGRFVAVISFCTTVQGELAVSSAEQLDTPADVEDFFFAFEPDEFLKRGKVHVSDAEVEQLATELYASFEPAMRELLAELPSLEKKESQSYGADASALVQDDETLANGSG